MAKSFRPGQLNPLTFSGRSSFATPDIITDNAMSVYHNSLSNLMAPNLLEGASEFTAVVLLSFKVDAPESSLFELIKSATVGTTSSDGPVGYQRFISIYSTPPKPRIQSPGPPQSSFTRFLRCALLCWALLSRLGPAPSSR